MNKLTALLIAMFFAAIQLSAQRRIIYTAEMRRNDSIIVTDIINYEIAAHSSNSEPNWQIMKEKITAKYNGVYADRTITRSQIYYYYGRDWPLFTSALVHYTEIYEDKENLPLMNKNADYILKHSNDKEEIRAAQSWIKHAVDKEPGNSIYKQTYQALLARLPAK